MKTFLRFTFALTAALLSAPTHAATKTRITTPLTLSADQTISWFRGHLFFGNSFDGSPPTIELPDQTIDTAGHQLTIVGDVTTVLLDRVAGSGGITVGTAAEEGQVAMTDLSSYTGVTTVMNGRLFVDNGANLGSSTGRTVVKRNGTLFLGNANALTEPIELEGNLIGAPDFPGQIGGALAFAGALTLVGDTNKVLTTTSELTTFTLTGRISGTGKLLAGGELRGCDRAIRNGERETGISRVQGVRRRRQLLAWRQGGVTRDSGTARLDLQPREVFVGS